MQQSTLNKVHSLDYGARGVCGAQNNSSSSGGSRNAQLVHSVSIVVELAKEQHPLPVIENQSFMEEADLDVDTERNRKEHHLTQSVDMLDDDDEQTVVVQEQQQQQQQTSNLDNADTDTDKAMSSHETDGGRAEADDNEDDEDDDDDDDDGGCLSSDLARKVVIVDEADKILRTRAQSAEPRIAPFTAAASLSAGAATSKATMGPHSALVPPPIPARTTLAGRPSGLTSAATCSPAMPTVAAAHFTMESRASPRSKAISSSSGGELAEHGELSKLSMRRNTHHYVMVGASNQQQQQTLAGSKLAGGLGGEQQPPSPPARWAQQRGGRSGSAQLERYPATSEALEPTAAQPAAVQLAATKRHSLAPKSPLAYAQQLRGGVAPIVGAGLPQACKSDCRSQRRQSLQINLLTGGGAAAAAATSSRLLTEEELRGEREFNKQVRTAKSPDIFSAAARTSGGGSALAQQQQQQQAGVSSGPAALGRRCHSVVSASALGTFDVSSSNLSSTPPTTSTEEAPSSSSKLVASSPKTTTDYHHQFHHPHSIVKLSTAHLHQRPQQQQQQQRQQQRHSQRRVSFSSIDPVLTRAPASSLCRASFAFQASNYYNNSSNTTDNNPTCSTADTTLYGPRETAAVVESSNKIATDFHNNNSGSGSSKKISGGSIDANGTSAASRPFNQQTSLALSTGHKHKRHSIAAYTAANDNNKLNLQLQRAYGFMDSSAPSGNDRVVAKWTTTTTSEIERRDLQRHHHHPRNSAASDSIVSTMNDHNDIIAEQQDPIRLDSTTILEVERQMDSFQTKLIDENERDVDTESNGNNWIITSSSSTSNTTIPTNAAKQQTAPTNTPKQDGSRVQSIMANARLRQEEFARLLEEHEQIVNEINRVETKISSKGVGSSSQINLQNQQNPMSTPQEEEKQ